MDPKKLPSRVLIVHSEVPPGAPPDEQDTLIQAQAVQAVLERAGVTVAAIPFTLEAKRFIEEVKRFAPDLIFNLIESVEGRARFLHIGAAVLDLIGVPYTGNSTAAHLVTTDKLLTKRILMMSGIPTPDCPSIAPDKFSADKTWILKSVHEDGSVGLDDSCVRKFPSAEQISDLIKEKERTHGGLWMAEEYIEGREINLGMYDTDRGVEFLTPSEIVFKDFPEGKPKIVGYPAKWNEESFEFKNTVHNYNFSQSDQQMLGLMKTAARRCWDVFELSGYVRVDFRVTRDGRPLVLEINTNPCISPDAGFPKAAKNLGISYDEVVSQIVKHPYKPV